MKDLLEIGKVTKPIGVKGRMKVVSYIESPHVLDSLQNVYIKCKDQNPELYKVKNIAFRKKSFSLDLEGIENSDTARSFVGCQIFISPEKLEKLQEAEYYWRDIIGLEVVTKGGLKLGKIGQIFATGSNDVYVCTGGEREILLPAIEEVIIKIDLEKGIMVVELLEGL